MTITVTYTSRHYNFDRIESRFVRQTSAGDYRWCETAIIRGRRFDVRQGTCDRDDLPDAVASAGTPLT